MGQVWYALAVGTGAALCLAAGSLALRRRYLLDDLPTATARWATVGLNELRGRVTTATPLRSPLTGTPCVYYAWTAEERFRRHERYFDEGGRLRARPVEGWERIGGDRARASFHLVDHTGSIAVDPAGAQVEGRPCLRRTVGRRHPAYWAAGRLVVAGSRGKRRLRETVVPVGAELYVLGPASLEADRRNLALRANRADPFIVAVGSGRRVARRYAWVGRGLLLAGVVLAAAAGALLTVPVIPVLVLVGGVGGLLGAAAAVLAATWNALVSARDRTERAWANLEVELQRRADLLPAFVAAVAATARHDHTPVPPSSRSAVAVPPATAGSGPGPSRPRRGRGGRHRDADVRWANEAARRQAAQVRHVLASAEADPGLHSVGVFAALGGELADTEDRLAHARTFFNDSVLALRRRARRLPGALVASPARFPCRELCTVEPLPPS